MQHGHEQIRARWGKTDAAHFAASAAENFRLIPLAGRHGYGIVRRTEGGLIVPNTEMLEPLIEALRAFAPEGRLLTGLDPLRLSISGSQNDDDGADVVVHTLNRLAAAILDSGLIACSHTTKSGAQQEAGAGNNYANAAYATSGSALYSQHARSNFFLARLTSKEIVETFGQHVTKEDAERQRVVRLTHARFSHGEEGAQAFLRMHKGTLQRIAPEAKPQDASEMIIRHGPAVLAAIERLALAGTQVTTNAVEIDRPLRDCMSRQDVRLTFRLLVQNGYLNAEGKTKDRNHALTSKARELLRPEADPGANRRESSTRESS